MMQPRTVQSTLAGALALALLATTGCSGDGPSSATVPPGSNIQAGPNIDFQAIIGTFANGKFLNNPTAYTQTSSIFASKKDPVNVAEWVTTSSATDYLKIEPSDTLGDSGETLPNVVLDVGTTIIRAVYDSSNTSDLTAVQAITFMTKGQIGYYPTFGDWAFGIVNPDGSAVALPDGGAAMLNNPGTLPGCHGGCHENDRGLGNDYLFGTENDARLPGLPKGL